MTDKPIIHASLVDARNVSSTKEIKLDVRIPAEMATKFLEIFGWPTPVSPVSVAIVPLAQGKIEPAQEPVSDDAFERSERQGFKELSRVRQAGILCNKPEFQAYLNSRFPSRIIANAEDAAEVVRWHCLVASRRDLDVDAYAQSRWDALEADFYAKSHGMRQ